KENTLTLNQTKEIPIAIPVTYKTSNSNLSVPAHIDFTAAAENTIHTVVHVKNTSVISRQPTIQDFMFGRRPQKAQIGTGSGVIISPDGYIITNNHVIDGSSELSVTLNNNKTYNAIIIGTDDKTDIALIKIEANEDLPFTSFGDSNQAKIGEWVLAVGNPFNLTSTVTAGIISAKSRDLSGQNSQSFIQTDAAVNPGNSGGALVNINGELIGINTAISSQTGSYIGYSFAVPSNIARKVVNDIMEFGNVQNCILGIIPRALNSYTAEKLGINETEGIYVEEVEKGSGADAAGIKSGDIIKKIADVEIAKFSDLRGFLDTKGPNDIVNVTILRDGIEKEVLVTLLKNQTFTLPIIGLLRNANSKDLRLYNVKNGVKIVRLNTNTPYYKHWINNGVEEGNIITAINGVKLNSVDDVQHIMKNRNQSDLLQIELINSSGEMERYNFR
ncbi:MAG: trypsin-like peptidase domain-containing protein, partial [Bacteroidetes bacterium]|nr:trypsin-like peptidase domain-containing protein [Bacteroidota bacterium]